MGNIKELLWVKFRFLSGKIAAETITMLEEAFKDEVMGKTKVRLA
jgi:hypothetical protein